MVLKKTTKIGLGALSAGVLGVLLAGAAQADIMDPLHGTCNGSSPAGSCSDNGSNTPLGGNSTQFGFTISPGPQTGDLTVVALIPNNSAFVPGSLTEIVPGSSVFSFSAVGGTWSSGTLAGFLGIAASPDNPIGAYLPTTDALDKGATGYSVYTADIGTLTISKNGGDSPTFDTIGGMPLGAYLVAFCADNNAKLKKDDCDSGKGVEVATANSGALLVNGNTPPPVPEPGTLALLGATLMLLGGSRYLRRRPQ